MDSKEQLIKSLEQALEAARQLPEEEQEREWPRAGDWYWFYNSYFVICSQCCSFSTKDIDRRRLESGNCFRSESEAIQARDDHLNWLEFCRKADWKDGVKFYPGINEKRNSFSYCILDHVVELLLPAFQSYNSLFEAAKGIEDSLVRHMKRMRKGI